MWRYAEALPSFADPVSLGEPVTPLVPFEQEGCEAWAKCEYLMPTGSYKDRGAALLISYLHEAGIGEAVEDSSGNAGASLAAYAARAGIRLKVFCPASASPGKLAQIRLYGAELVPIEGPRPRATEALLAYAEERQIPYASHLWHPLFIEGIKTLAYELAEQCAWQAPAAVLCPVGAGSILLGLYRGFGDLVAAGAVAGMPRLVAVQAAHVSPLYQAFCAGANRVEAASAPQPTLAEGIALPKPVRDVELLAAIRDTSGTVLAVCEDRIREGIEEFGRRGFCVEPTSAVVWEGLRQYREKSGLAPTARIVTVLSGHGLKTCGN
jgi:threonine synthase